MALDKIWVVAETTPDGAVATISLELLAKARELGGSIDAIVAGPGDAVAAELGEHGAARVLASGDLDGALPGPAVGAALAELAGSESPDLVLFGQTYDGREIASRMSVALDVPAVTNGVDREVDAVHVQLQAHGYTPAVIGLVFLVNSWVYLRQGFDKSKPLRLPLARTFEFGRSEEHTV